MTKCSASSNLAVQWHAALRLQAANTTPRKRVPAYGMAHVGAWYVATRHDVASRGGCDTAGRCRRLRVFHRQRHAFIAIAVTVTSGPLGRSRRAHVAACDAALLALPGACAHAHAVPVCDARAEAGGCRAAAGRRRKRSGGFRRQLAAPRCSRVAAATWASPRRRVVAVAAATPRPYSVCAGTVGVAARRRWRRGWVGDSPGADAGQSWCGRGSELRRGRRARPDECRRSRRSGS